MMVCPISRNIIRLIKELQPIHALLDPFAGSGTVLVEGMLSGIETVDGNDINPLALLLTKVKTTPLQHDLLARETDTLLSKISSRRNELSWALDSIDSYIIDTLGLNVAEKKGWGDEAPKYLEQFCTEKSWISKSLISKILDTGSGPVLFLSSQLLKLRLRRFKTRMFVILSL